MTLDEFVGKLTHVKRKRASTGYTAACPGHDDTSHDSLSVGPGTKKAKAAIVVHCFAGCSVEHILGTLGLPMSDLFSDDGVGVTLAAYAAAKRLPIEKLTAWGLAERPSPYPPYRPCVQMPFYDPTGVVAAVLYRLANSGAGKHRYRKGDHWIPYGLDRLADARTHGAVVLVEGPSDTQTLWHHGVPALGLPGNCWKPAWTDYLEGIPTIFVTIEPGQSGAGMLRSLAGSRIRDRVRLLSTAPHKDPSDMHVALGDAFAAAWQERLAAAVPWAEHDARTRAAAAAAAAETCGSLARAPRLLPRAVGAVRALGVVGERRAVALLTLAVVSRLLDKPVSVAVKGPSAAGKSFVVDRVLDLFPPSAAYKLTAMSERALAYDTEPLAHRMLVLYEAAGLRSDFASYLVRSLMSEGKLSYTTVEKTKAGLRPRTIERDGPMGLLVTTTLVRLHPENETRLLSVTVTDTREQTAAVLARLAATANAADAPAPFDLAPWHALHDWLGLGERRVVIPYAAALVDRIPPVAVRLRRDIGQVLALVRAHALLHRATRPRDDAGRIVATLADYATIRRLIEPLVSAGVGATVPATVRETITVVAAALAASGGEPVTVRTLAGLLKLDRSAAWRRAERAVTDGYLLNQETQEGRPFKLVLGDPLPDDTPVLPEARALRGWEGADIPPHSDATQPDGVTDGTTQPAREPPNPASDNGSEQDATGSCAVAAPQGGIRDPAPPIPPSGSGAGAIHGIADAAHAGDLSVVLTADERCRLDQEARDGDPLARRILGLPPTRSPREEG